MSDDKDNVPKIRFPGFTDVWEQCELSDLMDFSNGINAPKENYGKGRKMISVMDILTDGPITYEKIRSSVEVSKKTEDNNKVQNGDLIFVRSSEVVNEVGWAKAYLESQYALYSGFSIRGKKKDEFDARFIELSLNGRNRKQIERKAGGSTRFNVSQSILSSVLIQKPSISEQKKIGAFFEHLDHLSTLHQRKINNVQNLKAGLLQKMFPKDGEDFSEVRFPGFTNAWEQRELGEMGDTFTGLSGKTKEDFGHGDAKFVTYVNVFGNAISDPNSLESVEIDNKQKQVNYGDVFFTTSSETPEEVGMSSVWLENTENVYLNSFCFGYRPTIEFDLYYLAFMLRSPIVREKFMFLAQGISRYNISKNKVMEIKVPVPELEEQCKVGALFRELDHLITLHQRKLEHLQKQKKALLQQMFI